MDALAEHAGPRRCAVLGDPVGHSLSPVLHQAAYQALGLTDWRYDAVQMDSAGLPDFLAALGPDWRGLSLTMPLKRTVVPLLDDLDVWARRTGAANTVVFEHGAAALRRIGANTDVTGAVAALRGRTSASLDRAIVLGGGATATSTLLALGELGCREAVVLVREPSRAQQTLEAVGRAPCAPRLRVGRLGERVEAEVVVSTIPATAQTPELVRLLATVPVVFEVVYDPWPTPLAAAAAGSDRVLVTGLDLLLAQAAEQVRLMTGHDQVPVAAMREAGERELARRAGAPR